MIKFLVSIVLIIMFSGVLLWKQKVSVQENMLIKAIQQNVGSTFDSDYSLKTSGFPNRIDTEIKDIRLLAENGDYSVKLNRFVLMSLIYKSDHHILSIEPPFTIYNKKYGSVSVTKGNLRLSISRYNRFKRPSLILHGENLMLRMNGEVLMTIKDLIIAIRTNIEQVTSYQELSIKAHGVSLNRLSLKTEGIKSDLSLNFNFQPNKIEELKLNKIPLVKKIISEPRPLRKVTLEIIDTDLQSKKILKDLLSKLGRIIDF
jgi:hypothetical protein